MLVDATARYLMFSFMDGFSGYNQIRMDSRYVEKTAFRTPIGNFYCTVIPFGLKNIGATYQRAMTAIFHDMMHDYVEDYVDDVVVKSNKVDQHIHNLRRVFTRCREYNLRMNPFKCAFGVLSTRKSIDHSLLERLGNKAGILNLRKQESPSVIVLLWCDQLPFLKECPL